MTTSPTKIGKSTTTKFFFESGDLDNIHCYYKNDKIKDKC